MNEYSTQIKLDATSALASIAQYEQRLIAADRAIAQTAQGNRALEQSINAQSAVMGKLEQAIGGLIGTLERQRQGTRQNKQETDHYAAAAELLTRSVRSTESAIQAHINQLRQTRSELELGSKEYQQLGQHIDQYNNKLRAAPAQAPGGGGRAAALAGIGAAAAGIGGNLAFGSILAVGKEAEVASGAIGTLTKDSAALNQAIADLVKRNDNSTTSIAASKAAYDILSSGISDTKGNMDVLQGAIYAARGGFSTVPVVVDALTSTINAYGLSTKEAAKLSDQMIQTQNDGKLVVGDYAANIGKVAASAAAAKVPITEVNAAIALSTVAGVRPESAFTGLGQALQELLNPSEKAKKVAKELGVELSATTLQSKGLSGILQELKANGATIDQTSQIFGTESGRVINTLLNDLPKFEQFIRNQAEASGVAKAQADKLAGSFSDLSDKTANVTNELKVEVFQAVAPVLIAAAGGAKSLLQVVNGLPDPLKNTVATIVALGVGAAALLGPLGGIAFGISSIGSLLGPMAAGLGATASAAGLAGAATGVLSSGLAVLGAIFSPMGAAIAGVVAVLVLVTFQLQQFWTGVYESSAVIRSFVGGAVSLFQSGMSSIGEAWGYLQQIVGIVAGDVGNAIQDILFWFRDLGRQVGPLIDAALRPVIAFASGVANAFGSAAAAVGSGLSSIASTVVGWYNSLPPVIRGLIEGGLAITNPGIAVGLSVVDAAIDYGQGVADRAQAQRTAQSAPVYGPPTPASLKAAVSPSAIAAAPVVNSAAIDKAAKAQDDAAAKELKLQDQIADKQLRLQEQVAQKRQQLEDQISQKREAIEQRLGQLRESIAEKIVGLDNQALKLDGELRLAQIEAQYRAQERGLFGLEKERAEKLSSLLLGEEKERQNMASKERELKVSISKLGIEAKKTEFDIQKLISDLQISSAKKAAEIAVETARAQKEIAASAAAGIAAGGSVSGATSAAGFPITSGYGNRVHPIHGGIRFHDGIDIGAPTGTAISTTMGGTVNEAFWNGGYGRYVSVTLENGVKMFFGHLSEIAVRAGQKFGAGDLLGRIGNTGTSTGPHLHLGSPAGNPSGYLQFLKLGGQVAAPASGAPINTASPAIDGQLSKVKAISKVDTSKYEKALKEAIAQYDIIESRTRKVFDLEKAIAQLRSRENIKAYFEDYLSGIDNQNAALQDQIAFAKEYGMLIAAHPSVRAEEIEAQLKSVKAGEKVIAAEAKSLDLYREQLNQLGYSNAQLDEYLNKLEEKINKQIRFNSELRREQAIADSIKALSADTEKLRQSVADTLFSGSQIGLDGEAAARLQVEYDIQKRKADLEKQFGADVFQTNQYLAVQFEEFSRLSRAQTEAEIAVGKMNERYETLRGLSEGIAGDFKGAIKSILDGSKSAGEAFEDLFKSLTSRILDLVLNALFKPMERALASFLDKAISGIGRLFGGGGLGAIGGGFDAIGALGSIGGLFGDTLSAGASFSFTSIPGFANGGILPGGFRAFADGGIATMPTLGLIGEGSMNEAVVPLPNGRSIPVQMSGGAGRSGDVIVQQTFQFNTTALDARSVDQMLRERKGTIQQITAEGVRRSQQYATTMRTS